MFLDSATKRILVTSDATATTTESSVVASFVDYAPTATTPSEQDALTTGSTEVEVVSAPADGVQRHVKSMTIYNDDTVSHTYTVKLDNGVSKRKIVAMTLSPGRTMQYTQANGWEITEAAAAAHQSVTATVTAENEFTTGLLVKAGDAVSISISGTFTAEVTFQRNLDGTNYRDVQLPDGSAGWSAPVEMTYFADETGFVRLGVKTGDFTDGSVVVRLGVN